MMFQNHKLKLAILISNAGTGTNLQAIIDGISSGRIKAEICAVISDKTDAPGLERAREYFLKIDPVRNREGSQRPSISNGIEICPKKEDLLLLLQKLNPDYICLAGWKQIITDEVILTYPNKILNLHPGLIPDTTDDSVKNPDGTDALWNKGMLTTKAIQNFLDRKAPFAGSSIHFLTLNFDFGPVLGRTFEKIEAEDNVESLYSRLKKKENQLYVEVLEKLTSPPAPLRVSERVAKDQMRYEKILIIGGGGREHAIGWKVAQSPRAGKIFFAPGNAGTAEIGINVPISATNIPKLLEFAKKEKIDLTLALPDDPLELGIVDEFQKAGLRIWGPTKAASELEWSKAYAKDFMKRHNIPTAEYKVFNDFGKAKTYIEKALLPIVVKASGLALGKGVTVAQTKKEALEALHKILVDKIFGASGNEVVIEEFLAGTEISIHAISDGKNYKIFPTSQDHKRIFDGDIGPNTGGMGVVAPLPFVNEALLSKIEEKIIAPITQGMAKEGRPFVGCLYPGVMLTSVGPKVFEINARFGDPEAQVYMRLLRTDLLDIVDACINQKLDEMKIEWANLSACNVALASGGYPGNYPKGKVIYGIEEAATESDIVIFHAGTKMEKGKLLTNGGRVLGVSAVGATLEESLAKAYKAIEKISFKGMQYRKDIGKKVLKKRFY